MRPSTTFFSTMAVPLISEFTLPGFLDFTGVAQVGNLTEGPSVAIFTSGDVTNNKLIQTDQQVKFDFAWTVQGMFAHAINPLFRWKIEVFFEKYGPGEFAVPGGLGVRLLDYGSGTFLAPDKVQYPGLPNSTSIVIPPFTIEEGVYDIVALITMIHGPSPDDSPCFVAAFAEFNKIAFYREHTAV